MSPRMMLCPECGKKNAFMGIHIILEEFSRRKNIPYEQAWDIGYDFLKQKQEEAKLAGGIYFDEDDFYDDLTNYLKDHE